MHSGICVLQNQFGAKRLPMSGTPSAPASAPLGRLISHRCVSSSQAERHEFSAIAPALHSRRTIHLCLANKLRIRVGRS
jgi:hypothetical protein